MNRKELIGIVDACMGAGDFEEFTRDFIENFVSDGGVDGPQPRGDMDQSDVINFAEMLADFIAEDE